jgi:hypothetical protein
MRPQEETSRVVSRVSLDRELLTEYPEEVGSVLFRVLVHGEDKILSY